MGTIIKPSRGWQERTYYLVEVSFCDGNPKHRAIFYTGFLSEKGDPSGYNCLFNPSWEPETQKIGDVNYMKAIRVLYDPSQEENGYK